MSAAAQPGSVAFNPPSNLVGAAQDGPQVQLTWNTNSTTGTGFTIERATDAAFTDERDQLLGSRHVGRNRDVHRYDCRSR